MTNFVAPIERSMLAKAGWATLAALVLGAPASAQQRDPAYSAARASGSTCNRPSRPTRTGSGSMT